MIMLVAVPTHFVSGFQEKVCGAIAVVQNLCWHKPSRANLVLSLDAKQGIALASPQKTRRIHIMERYEHRTFAGRPAKRRGALRKATRQNRVQEKKRKLEASKREPPVAARNVETPWGAK